MDKLSTDLFTHTVHKSTLILPSDVLSRALGILSVCLNVLNDLWHECLYFLDKNDVCIRFFRFCFSPLTHKNCDRTLYLSGSFLFKTSLWLNRM